MNETKYLSFEEKKLLSDSHTYSSNSRIEGHVVIKDASTGKVLLSKKNLVLRTGRSTTLRKIFNLPDIATNESESLLKDKSVMLFGLGVGGAPSSDLFTIFSPSPADTELNSPIPFRSSTASNPLSGSEILLYSDYRSSYGNSTDWYKKTFSNGNGTIVIDAETDECFVKLQLQITAEEVRDQFVNELGLYWAKYNAAGADQNSKYSSYKIFSRITFLTEPFPANTSKALDIDYYIYL